MDGFILFDLLRQVLRFLIDKSFGVFDDNDCVESLHFIRLLFGKRIKKDFQLKVLA